MSAAINHAGRKRANKERLGEAAIAQQQRSGGSRMIKIRSYEKRWREQKESQPLG